MNLSLWPCYEWVVAKYLTPQELRASRLPDEFLHSILVGVTSMAGNHYLAVHYGTHPEGPHILLCGFDKDETDFRGVEGIIARETRGKAEGRMTDRGDDIRDVIWLPEQPTQARVADYVERYGKQFKQVSIPAAEFLSVPKHVCGQSGFPLKKLAFK